MKQYIFFLFILFTFSLHPILEGAGWGKTNEIVLDKVNCKWDRVYCELKDLSMTAYVPYYSGGSLQNGNVFLRGKIDNIGYAVMTSYNPEFNPPSSLEAFYELVQANNLEHNVVAINAEAFGAKYALDLLPLDENNTPSWRFLCTENRLIKMGTEDNDNARRTFFFNSISITDGGK